MPNFSSERHVIYNQQNMGIGSAVGQRKNEGREPRDSPEQIEQQVDDIERKSTQILFRTRTVFPFDFFPDTLTINANKIDVVKSQFFASSQTTSIPLRDIANVEVQTAPFFATLRIINIRYPMHPIVLTYLRKKRAIKAKNIIDGLLIAVSQGTDLSRIEPDKFLRQIEEAGKSPAET